MTTGQACACQRVKYDPKDNGDGTLTERWRCGDCQTEFVKAFRLEQTLKAGEEYYSQLMEERKLRHSLELRLGRALALINAALRRQSAAVDTVEAAALLEECAGAVEKACVHEWVEGVAFGGASYCRKCDAIKAGAVEKHESLVDRMAPKIEEGMRAVGAKAKQIFEEEMFKPQPGVERPVQIRRFVDCGHEISGPDLDELATVCVICHPQGRPSE
jgi:hypothetical protein